MGRCVCLGHYARKMPFLDKTQWTGWHVEKGHPWEVGMGHHSYVLITNGAGNRPSECLIINRQVSQPVAESHPIPLLNKIQQLRRQANGLATQQSMENVCTPWEWA